MNERNRAVIDEFRSNRGIVTIHRSGQSLLLLTTTGAKTGRQITSPVAYHRDGDRLVVVASKAGAPENPAWYHNLRANPTVMVEVGEEKFAATATVAQGDERERLYGQHMAHFSDFQDYESRTTRKFPVIILTRQ